MNIAVEMSASVVPLLRIAMPSAVQMLGSVGRQCAFDALSLLAAMTPKIVPMTPPVIPAPPTTSPAVRCVLQFSRALGGAMGGSPVFKASGGMVAVVTPGSAGTVTVADH